jgi:hypothetical protein
MFTGDLFYGVTGVICWYLFGVAVRRGERSHPPATEATA